jgi:hypothetical protein
LFGNKLYYMIFIIQMELSLLFKLLHQLHYVVLSTQLLEANLSSY